MTAYSPTIGLLQAQKEALSFFTQDPELEENVAKISLACSKKGVISTKTYERILGAPSGKRQVVILVNGISTFIRVNKDNFNGFGVFLYLLQLTSCEELAKKLDVLLKEAIERTCKAQASSKKSKVHRKREDDARLKALENNWDNLVSVCERMLNPIASDCLTKKIVTKQVYQEATRKPGNKKAKAELFLKHVCTAILKDSTNFEIFLNILKKRRPCSLVAREVEFCIGRKHELVVPPASTLPPRGHVALAPDLPVVLKPFGANASFDSSTGEGNVCPESHGIQEVASEGNDDLAVDNSGNIQSLKSHKQRMDERRENKEDLRDLTQKNENLKEENYKIILDIEVLKKELSEKQSELRDKELEKDKLTEEVRTLEMAVCKAKESDQVKVLKTRIAERERDIGVKDKRIQTLEKEKNKLMKDLSGKNSELDSTKKVLLDTQQVLNEVRRLSQQQSIECQNMHRENRCTKYVVIALLVIVIVCVLFCLYKFH